MTEVQKLNASPVSQAIRSLLPPQPESQSLYILLWIRQTLRLAESEGLTEEVLTPEEAGNLEMLTFSEPSEARNLYRMLVPPSGEPWSGSELLKKVRETQKAQKKQKPKDLSLTPAEMELLQMFKENLDSSGADLAPSLHETDR